MKPIYAIINIQHDADKDKMVVGLRATCFATDKHSLVSSKSSFDEPKMVDPSEYDAGYTHAIMQVADQSGKTIGKLSVDTNSPVGLSVGHAESDLSPLPIVPPMPLSVGDEITIVGYLEKSAIKHIDCNLEGKIFNLKSLTLESTTLTGKLTGQIEAADESLESVDEKLYATDIDYADGLAGAPVFLNSLDEVVGIVLAPHNGKIIFRTLFGLCNTLDK